MTPESEQLGTGYTVQRIYAVDQNYQALDPDTEDLPESREVDFMWDWRVQEHLQGGDEEESTSEGEVLEALVVDVAIGAQLAASERNPYVMRAMQVGQFRVGRSPELVPLHQFVRLNGVAIVLPYLRETLASLSERGPSAAYHLPVLNVKKLMEDVPHEHAQGWDTLTENPDLAEAYGVPREALKNEG